MHKLVCDLSTGIVSEVPLSEEEVLETLARQNEASLLAPTPATPTAGQLLAKLQELQEQINALA
jgi:hypothetical protein